MHLFTFTSILSTFIYALFCDWKLLLIQTTILAGYFLLARRYNGRDKTSVRRKMVMGAWGEPNDSTCYAQVQVDAGKIDEYIQNYNKTHPEEKITYTHYFLKLLGVVFTQIKGLNGKLVFGRFVPYDSVNVQTVVNVDNKDIAAAVVKNCDTSSLSEIRSFLNEKVKKLKKRKDKEFNANMRLAKILPTPLISVVLNLFSFLSFFLEVKFGGVKPNFLGNIILTNVTNMEIEDSFAPNTSFARSMCTVVLNKPTFRPVADENLQVVVRKIMNVNISFDHRFADGAQGSLMALKLKEIVANPGKFLE